MKEARPGTPSTPSRAFLCVFVCDCLCACVSGCGGGLACLAFLWGQLVQPHAALSVSKAYANICGQKIISGLKISKENCNNYLIRIDAM